MKPVPNLVSSDDHKQWMLTKRGLNNEHCHELLIDVSQVAMFPKLTLGLRCTKQTGLNPKRVSVWFSEYQLPVFDDYADSIFQDEFQFEYL